MKLTKKISAKEILGNVVDVVKEMEIGSIIEAYGVAGICKAYMTGISTFGEWVRLIGEFEAVNYVTGEQVRGSGVHVPDVLQEALFAAVGDKFVRNDKKCTKDNEYFELNAPIEFAFKVDIERLEDKENGAINYKYHTKPMTKVAENDGLSHLTKLIASIAPPKEVEEKSGKKDSKK